MGFLDQAFKNVVKGAKDIVKGPGGIMLLGAAAPYLAAGLGGTGAMAGLKSAMNPTLLKALGSPWIKNALTNAAIQGGIAGLTRSKHPWKAMGTAALTSLPFTAACAFEFIATIEFPNFFAFFMAAKVSAVSPD